MRYINATHGLAMSIGCKLAESMGLVESDLFKGWACQYRLNKYNFNPQTLGRTGVPIHTDSGFLTIVQDDGGVGGLEVVDTITGNLVPIEPMPGTLLVNLGDIAKVRQNLLSDWKFSVPGHTTVSSHADNILKVARR